MPEWCTKWDHHCSNRDVAGSQTWKLTWTVVFTCCHVYLDSGKRMILRETIFVLAFSVGVACPLTAQADRAPLALAGRAVAVTAKRMPGVWASAKRMGLTVS